MAHRLLPVRATCYAATAACLQPHLPPCSCAECNDPLSSSFFVHDGALRVARTRCACARPADRTADNVYCTKDYEEKFAVRCAVCRETGAAAQHGKGKQPRHQPRAFRAVTGQCLRHDQNTYHTQCFVCCDCKVPLETSRFFKVARRPSRPPARRFIANRASHPSWPLCVCCAGR